MLILRRALQVQGVRFMYACLETGSCQGPTRHAPRGCILADDMGLGKTVQVLALLWTLLRQGSTVSEEGMDGRRQGGRVVHQKLCLLIFFASRPSQGKPVIRKALVVAPATLVENWGGETSKWLGSERIRPVLLPSGPEVMDKVREMVPFVSYSIRHACTLLPQNFPKDKLCSAPRSRLGSFVTQLLRSWPSLRTRRFGASRASCRGGLTFWSATKHIGRECRRD